MQPAHSFPPGSGWTARHWAQGFCAGAIAGAAATAQAFPVTSGVCHVIQAVTTAWLLQLGLTTDSIAAARRLERAERITPRDWGA
jgi:hypothetical protein